MKPCGHLSESKPRALRCSGASGGWSRRNDLPRAFTLIELLVAIAVIAIMVGLLLPGLARSKATAQRVACLGNLRQMGIAARSYAADHDDFYPTAYYNAVEKGVNIAYGWDLTAISENPPRVEPGLLWEGQGAERVQQCPSFAGKANWIADQVTGYNYNTSYIGHGQFESIQSPAKAATVKQPGATVIFGDGQYASGANKFMRAPWPNPGDDSFNGRWAGTQGFRHLGKSNASFCDGHAESLRDRYTNNANGAARVAAGTGFLSPDNSLYDLE